jgi:predicted RNase H-like nuclease (RuvC/YqgF family)
MTSLDAKAKELERRLAAAEGAIEEQKALAAELGAARERLEGLERASLLDGKRVSELEERLRFLEEDRARDTERLDRLERALGIDP